MRLFAFSLNLISVPSIVSFQLLCLTLVYLPGVVITSDGGVANEPSTSSSGAFSLILMPRERSCVFDFMKAGVQMRSSYDVLRGGAQLDINFQILDANDDIVVTDSKKSNNRFFFTPAKSGDYKICLDNSFSPFSSKVVYFDFYSSDQMDGFNKHEKMDKAGRVTTPSPSVVEEVTEQQLVLNMKVEEIEGVMQHIKRNLRGSSYNMGLFRNLEFKDRKIAESNFDLVNRTSLVSVIAILCTGLAQVLLIRVFFSAKMSSQKGLKIGL